MDFTDFLFGFTGFYWVLLGDTVSNSVRTNETARLNDDVPIGVFFFVSIAIWRITISPITQKKRKGIEMKKYPPPKKKTQKIKI